MIKVTFQTGSGGVYWAVCERVSLCVGDGTYLLDSVIEDSWGMGPAAGMKTPENWQIMTVKEA